MWLQIYQLTLNNDLSCLNVNSFLRSSWFENAIKRKCPSLKRIKGTVKDLKDYSEWAIIRITTPSLRFQLLSKEQYGLTPCVQVSVVGVDTIFCPPARISASDCGRNRAKTLMLHSLGSGFMVIATKSQKIRSDSQRMSKVLVWPIGKYFTSCARHFAGKLNPWPQTSSKWPFEW